MERMKKSSSLYKKIALCFDFFPHKNFHFFLAPHKALPRRAVSSSYSLSLSSQSHFYFAANEQARGRKVLIIALCFGLFKKKLFHFFVQLFFVPHLLLIFLFPNL